jgi:hypothetical protein
MVETMPDRGEIDGGVLPKCNGRRTVCRKIVSEGLRFFWLMFRGHGSKLVLDQELKTMMCESTLETGTSCHIAYAYVEGDVG